MNSNTYSDNAKLFEQNKELLKTFTKDELDSLLNHYNFIVRRRDNLWELCYFSDLGNNMVYSVTGANLVLLLHKMIKVKEDSDRREQDRNIMRITNGC